MDVPTIIFIGCLAVFGLFMLWWVYTMLFSPSPPRKDGDLGEGIGSSIDPPFSD